MIIDPIENVIGVVREEMLKKLAKGINDMGTQIPDHSPGEDKWYEILKSILDEDNKL